jgi:hypothetical protein
MCNTMFCFLLTFRAHPFICLNEPFPEKLTMKKTKETFNMNKYRTTKCVFTFYNNIKHKKYLISTYIYA